ncbi:unnamed protein product [Adineta steineri]|uniref:NAD(P)(+)--arginine ADP-ribosyltransferase n=1 Tax=Adineta steineri TaxID=433720 RepID=A0A814TK33_9BILA|nr:unnamed protein product [Adineta steineri]CAF4208842.1 unnamed protein product [Adineta steineri]
MVTSSSSASILLRPHDYQWCWYSSAANEGEAKWQKYMDVENEIIEDAYNEKKTKFELDGNYMIDLEHLIEYKKGDCSKRRYIKRGQRDSLQSSVYLRQERFSLPITPVNSTVVEQVQHVTDALRHIREDGNIFSAYCNLIENEKTFADIVEEAANGIIKEGTTIEQAHTAEWISKQLIAVKNYGTNIKIDRHSNTRVPLYIGQTCVSLYSKSTFWFRLINQTLRDYHTVSLEQVKTLGPFCWLLQKFLYDIHRTDVLTVYRGVELDYQQRKQFMKEAMKFTFFTSTSKNRSLAEMFGNTLLVINLEGEIFGYTYYPAAGADISTLSNFPEEEEFLIWPGTYFQFVDHEYNSNKQQHIIYLKIQGGG